MDLIGRKNEQKRLLDKVKSNKSELVAVLGRRRVGKTFLIRETFKKQLFFHFTGLYQSNLPEQLERFTSALSDTFLDGLELKTPRSWFDALDHLKDFIEQSRSKKKKVIFLDEFPWMATNRSRFLTAFTDFWNSFAASRKDIMVVICGSAASWMINKVLKNKGGLYNRVTERIILKPFTLKETELFLQKNKIAIDKEGIARLYMAIGGIPYYLDLMNKGESVVQAMDRLCFAENAPLRLEYGELMESLFGQSEAHEKIIVTLSAYPQGLTRDELITEAKLVSGGGTTRILEELEHSDFISALIPYGKKRNAKKYKLKDYYTRFYFKYIADSRPSSQRLWEKIHTSPSWRSWIGLAFENLCLDHVAGIKIALKIDGIQSTASTWYAKGTDEMLGAQVDLVIDRKDKIINICEIKFSSTPFVITGDYVKKMRMKMASFTHFTKSRKTLFPTFITTHGLVPNKHSEGFVQNDVTLEDLFV